MDFTNPEAVRWWQDKHRPYLRKGVAAFKPDYGEAVPADAVFADGRTGEQVHNLYPLLYNKATYEVMREERGEAMLFSRSGYAGSQRYPINWTGDAPVYVGRDGGDAAGRLEPEHVRHQHVEPRYRRFLEPEAVPAARSDAVHPLGAVRPAIVACALPWRAWTRAVVLRREGR